jgi:hypothetical protein
VKAGNVDRKMEGLQKKVRQHSAISCSGEKIFLRSIVACYARIRAELASARWSVELGRQVHSRGLLLMIRTVLSGCKGEVTPYLGTDTVLKLPGHIMLILITQHEHSQVGMLGSAGVLPDRAWLIESRPHMGHMRSMG